MAEAISIIAVIGASGSGKSTAAQHLVDRHGYTRIRFAQPLKEMLMTLGLTREQVDGPQELRNQPADILCGRSPRYAVQKLGTEWRDMIDKQLWARITRKRVSDLIASGVTKIVIDDMRFAHEAEMFREIGCQIIAVRRPCVEPTPRQRFFAHLPVSKLTRALALLIFDIHLPHISEIEWFKIEPDVTIQNTGTLAALYRKLKEAVT